MKSLLVVGVVIVAAIILVPVGIVQWTIIIFTLVVLSLVVNFFRDPERKLPAGERMVISPADGKIVLIKEVFEPEYLKSDAVQVSIFMSPLDVHVNRFPISGTIEHFRHIDGKFMAAFHEKSSDENERTHIGIRNDHTALLMKQVAGTVARRIVADLNVGMPATLGQRFGMIKYGSRVDIALPKSAQVLVTLNQRVTAGETILAKY